MTHIGLAGGNARPSFMVVHPNGHYLYAVSEKGKKEDTLSAFAIDAKSGKLTA